MSDIVERLLRGTRTRLGLLVQSDEARLRSSAADEITRLRAELAAERERCYQVAISTTCDVGETADYYSGYCDGVQDAANSILDRAKGEGDA